MSKTFTVASVLISFVFGYFLASFNPNSNHNPSTSSLNSIADPIRSIDIQKQNLYFNDENLKDITRENKQKLFQIITQLPSSKLSSYLEQIFPDQSLESIANKRKFAERLIEEIDNDKDESESLSGKVYTSLNASDLSHLSTLKDLHPNQYIYAHFDTFGKMPPNSQVFVKWINSDTQEMVLFTPKAILENSHQNWVSTVPDGGWKPGNYSVKFFQMNDKLTPIAQANYTISTVLN